MNYYENIFILAPSLDDSAVEKTVDNVKNVVLKHGGEILKTENWGSKKLAYDLKKQNKGIYVLIVFKSPPAVIQELERSYKVLDTLLKFMIVKLGKKQIEAMIASLTEKSDQVSASPLPPPPPPSIPEPSPAPPAEEQPPEIEQVTEGPKDV